MFLTRRPIQPTKPAELRTKSEGVDVTDHVICRWREQWRWWITGAQFVQFSTRICKKHCGKRIQRLASFDRRPAFISHSYKCTWVSTSLRHRGPWLCFRHRLLSDHLLVTPRRPWPPPFHRTIAATLRRVVLIERLPRSLYPPWMNQRVTMTAIGPTPKSSFAVMLAPCTISFMSFSTSVRAGGNAQRGRR